VRYVGPILSLTFLIALHELGHVFAASLFGIKLERFSLGLGPTLFSGRRRGTQLALGAILVGAFAQLRGMNPHAVNFDRRDPHSFASKPFWARGLIVAAGPLANFALTFAVLVSLYYTGTHVSVAMRLGTVAPGSEAARAQLRAGDVILAVEHQPVTRWSQLATYVAAHPEQPLTVLVRREDQTFEAQLVPRRDADGKGSLGITEQYVFRRHSFTESLRKASSHTASLFAQGLHLVQRLAVENVTRELTRRVSAASVTGLDAWLRALAAFSLALGVFHLLPFPPLDGGRIILSAFERATGKELHPRLESLLHALGTIALVAGLGWLLARDVARLLIDARAPRDHSSDVSSARQEDQPRQ
jgi:regulator of sigma E protease